MKNEKLNRRKFLNIAGLAATATVMPLPSFAEESNTVSEPINANATIIESKIICQ